MGEVITDLCRFGLASYVDRGQHSNASSIPFLIGHAILCHESGMIILTNISEFECINKFAYIIINSSTGS